MSDQKNAQRVSSILFFFIQPIFWWLSFSAAWFIFSNIIFLIFIMNLLCILYAIICDKLFGLTETKPLISAVGLWILLIGVGCFVSAAGSHGFINFGIEIFVFLLGILGYMPFGIYCCWGYVQRIGKATPASGSEESPLEDSKL